MDIRHTAIISHALLSLSISLAIFFSPVYAEDISKDFVILEEEIPGLIVELRYATDDNFLGRPVEGYASLRCMLSRPAAMALKEVQKELNTFGLGLKVFDAYRPQRAVDDFVVWAKVLDDTKMKQRYYPDVAKKDLFAKGYIAARSGHSRGSSVDLTIVSYDTGSPVELDMGTSWDLFGPRSWGSDLSVTSQQRANRMLLQKVMQMHGFKALKEEWWHFTLEAEPYPEIFFDFLTR